MLRARSEHIMVGCPNDFILAQRRTISFEPPSDPGPGNDGIEQASERIDGRLQLADDAAGIAIGDESQPVFGRLPIRFSAASDEFLDLGQSLR